MDTTRNMKTYNTIPPDEAWEVDNAIQKWPHSPDPELYETWKYAHWVKFYNGIVDNASLLHQEGKLTTDQFRRTNSDVDSFLIKLMSPTGASVIINNKLPLILIKPIVPAEP